ncbi:hypothetical protein Tco_0071265 [Tanacetum coccineum]
MKFLRALPLKWRAKVTTIEEVKDLATLSLDELIGNLNVYEMVLENDGVVSNTIKEKVMLIALKAKVTRGQTSRNRICQDESKEDDDEDEEINLMANNFRKLFRNGNRIGRQDRLDSRDDKIGKGFKKHDKFDICNYKNKIKGGEVSRHERGSYNCSNKNHFIGDCPKPKKRRSLKEHGAILKTVINQRKTHHVLWKSTLKRYVMSMISGRIIRLWMANTPESR